MIIEENAFLNAVCQMAVIFETAILVNYQEICTRSRLVKYVDLVD